MNKELVKSLFEIFGVIPVGSESVMLTNGETLRVQQDALAYGYVLMPDAATRDAEAIVDRLRYNPNATFYKEWRDVTSKTRLQLFIDQIIHYATTYGTDFTWGNGYVPNADYADLYKFNLTAHKVINAVTYSEMYDMCVNMLNSGIALKHANVKALVDYIVFYNNFANLCIDSEFVSEIKNREARIVLYNSLNLFPIDKFEMLRYMVFKATNMTNIVKNDGLLRHIKKNNYLVDFTRLTENQCKALASIFFRYKDVILMFKNTKNAPVINKIRRLANKYHKPMKTGFWESLTVNHPTVEEVWERSAELSNFKLITLIQMFKLRCVAQDKQLYIIRNGKQFVKSNYAPAKTMLTNMYAAYADTLTKRLVENMRDKACVVRLNDNIELTCPTSEKNFIGAIPFGSRVQLAERDNILGIYWRNAWGTRDFDLSMNDVNGRRIGWNSRYYDDNNDVIYSGDMTNADPEAAEMLWMSRNVVPGSVFINRYNGNQNSKFRFFVANGKNTKLAKFNAGYMCDPNDIVFDCMCESSDNRQTNIGFVDGQYFYFMGTSGGDTMIARTSGYTQADMFNIVSNRAQTMVYLRDVLTQAGFTIIDETYVTEEGANVLDLTTQSLTVEKLITLFDKNV